MKQLILGGARSGKSSLAEKLATDSEQKVIYIATTNRAWNDAQMDKRVEHHQESRPTEWMTVETPIELANSLQQHAAVDSCILVDCLTLWLSNCLQEKCWQEQKQQLLDNIDALPGSIIFVSNEVGHGIVPLGEGNRQFVDESGFLHQALARHCDRVVFAMAGLPITLKGETL